MFGKSVSESSGRMIVITLAFIFILVAMQRILFPVIPVTNPPKNGEPCKGMAIYLDYPYEGEMLMPHECAIQCEDNKWRYLVYTNGKATQCETPPMCSDWGEDNEVTCEIPKISD